MFLNIVAGGKHRQVHLNSTECLVVTLLMGLQCLRRAYETAFIQIFSRNSRLDIKHYCLSNFYYILIMPLLVANAEGFIGDSSPSPINFSKLSVIQYISIVVYLFCWWQQYQSNLILIRLRKNFDTGKQITEKHLLPKGGYFELISSPHMFFEIGLYVSLLFGFFVSNVTWWIVVVFVLSNQIYSGLQTHIWYMDNFKNYPRNRKAILPFIL
ncbi:polyprenal reductase-like [Musca autumnalis]|uniref:polyprenal reductase-like n=1 Tax=Musca autumnalis TaxID=221902 RepID=UPI003CEC615D